MLLQEVLPWTLFAVRAARVREVSPHLVRATFVSLDPEDDVLRDFADAGADTRLKLLFPTADGRLGELIPGGDWYQQWRALPDARRPAMRTYTVRAVRPATDGRPAEVDVDLVLHGVVGPASAWASAMLVADPDDPTGRKLLLCGPNAAHGGPYGGREWKLPTPADDLLVVGDETALPAIAAILEELPPHATGRVLVEIPAADDELHLMAPPGMVVDWLPRGDRPDVDNGSLMTAAALAWTPRADGPPAAAEVPPNDEDVLWEVPDDASDGGSAGGAPGIRAWVAGEASAVKEIRRHLVGTCGLPRREVAFMGYWRRGRAEVG